MSRDGGDSSPPAGAEELSSDLEALGPTFVKLGQLLSTRPDLLPPAYVESLARLQDDVTSFPFEQVERIVTDELGVRLSKAFSEFESTPLAAASLAQVHRARLRDGREVAVKVQRPDIRERVALDLEALGEIAAFVDRHSRLARRYRVSAILEQFARALHRELDFRQEAANLSQMAHSLARFERLVVPTPIADYTTSRVLTMDYVDGTKLDELSPVVHTDLPGEELANELLRAYLHQVLVDGTFHADPHPGNVLLTRDHRIALIDLGMVGHIQAGSQANLLKLLIAISEGRGDEAARISLEMADRAQEYDEASFSTRVADLIAVHGGKSLEHLPAGRLMIEVCRLAADSGVLMPPELSLLGKTLLNLDRVGHALFPAFDPNATIRHSASQLVTERMGREATLSKLYSSLLETKELIEALPQRVNQILELVAENRLRVEVDAIDEERLVTSVEKVANRITSGLVLASLIVGAAMLADTDTPFTILGYPGIAFALFSAAALGGFWLLVTILREGR